MTAVPESASRFREALPETLPVTQALKERFEAQGYLAFDRITSEADLSIIRTTLGNLFARRAGFDEGAFYDLAGVGDEDGNFLLPQLVDPRSFAPALTNTEFFRNALEIARALLGPEATFMADHALMKPADVGGATPWHQDEAFQPGGRLRNEVSIWMPLQPVDLINGCMGFIPRSHNNGVLPHRSMNGNERIHAVECFEGFDEADAVYCPIPAGGCTIHTSRTVHGAGPNRSSRPRFAYVLVFQVPSIAIGLPQDRPWLAGKVTPRMTRRQNWMRHGGIFVHAWRRLKQTKQIGYREMAVRIASKIRTSAGYTGNNRSRSIRED